MHIFPIGSTSFYFACGTSMVQKRLYFLYTQGNPPCYSQTHHIFFYAWVFFSVSQELEFILIYSCEKWIKLFMWLPSYSMLLIKSKLLLVLEVVSLQHTNISSAIVSISGFSILSH